MNKFKKISLYSVIAVVVFSCGERSVNNESEEKQVSHKQEKMQEDQLEPTKGEKIVDEAVITHGGERYDVANYAFVFRKKEYHFKNEGDNYSYQVQYLKGEEEIVDQLEGGSFSRTMNGEDVKLSEKEIAKYSGALNSVIYFATLPHKLKDKSVRKKYINTVEIKGKSYEVVEITFAEEGGGEDFEDQYYYWFEKETKRMDYFAYNYQVNGGGVRFRSAYNQRTVEGVIFQDYINYKANLGTPLSMLPELYEKGELEELSRIDTENVVKL